MQIGSLDTRIDIQTRTLAVDAAGQPVETWSLFRSVWAKRVTAGVREKFLNRIDQETASRMVIFRIRWLAGINEQFRIVDEGTTYDIMGIADNRRQGWMELSCRGLNPADTGT